MKIPEDLYPEIISAVIGILTIISSAVFLAINMQIFIFQLNLDLDI